MSEELEVIIPKKFHFDATSIEKVKKIRRPSLFTDARKKRILLAFKAGASERYAAGYAGITVVTLRRWLSKGEDGDDESKGVEKDLYLFAQACLEARSQNALFILKNVMDGIKGNEDKGLKPNPELALKALGVIHSDEYGQKSGKITHEIKGKIEHEHTKKLDVENLSLEELEQLEAIHVRQLEEGNIVDVDIIGEEQ